MSEEKKPTPGAANVIAHTLITVVVLAFAGAGMLMAKLHYGWFIFVAVVSVGWVPPAVAGNALMRILDAYARAVYALPPGTIAPGTMPDVRPAAAPAAASAAPAESAPTPMPPPGIAGLLLFAGTMIPALRGLTQTADALTIALGLTPGAIALLSYYAGV